MHPKKTVSRTAQFARRLALTASVALSLASAHAAVTWKNIQFGGFFSQGYLKSTENNFPVDTKDGTFDFREMAVNASTTFGTHLRVGAQVFAQKLGKYGDDEPILDWAVIDYNFRPEFGVQVGRLKYPRGLYSDVLDVDMVRPFIFLPQSNYDARLRDFQASFDGAKVYGSVSAGSSSFDYKFYYGDIPMKTDSGVADYFNTTSVYANPPGISEINTDSVYGGALNWNTPVAGLRVGLYYSVLSHLKATGPFRQVPVFSTSIDLLKIHNEGISIEYTNGPWTLASEYLLSKSGTQITIPPQLGAPQPPEGKYATRSYYFSVARRLGDKFEAGAYYSESRNCYPSAGTSSQQNRRGDLAAALRYDVNEHILVKLEVHSINGSRDITNVPGISNPPADLKNSMILFAAKTTLSF